VPGTTSFSNLLTINGQTYITYQQACLALGMAYDDTKWIQCFDKAMMFSIGHAPCRLFATTVMYSSIIDSTQIWSRFQQHFCNDLPYQLQQSAIPIPQDIPTPHLDYILYHVFVTGEL